MRFASIACAAVVLLAVAAGVWADDSRTYSRSIELTWDEAVKAIRDAELVLTDSNRSEHWFTMRSSKKSLAKTAFLEVRLTETGGGTQVAVRELENAGSKRSVNAVAKYLAALDKRMR
jgi:hypothetical protein